MKRQAGKLSVFMMDLLATVPYYTAYLSMALLSEGVPVTIGSISYYLDLQCFSSRNLELDPGLSDVVARLHLPRTLRRTLKLAEAILNLATLALRFCVFPPDIIHVQYLPMLRWPVPLDAWFVAFCRVRGPKIVLTVHDLLPHDTGRAYHQRFERLYRRVDRIICHSPHVATRLQEEFRIPARMISVIPHGPFFYDLPSVTPALSPALEADEVMILWQGIVFPYKGIDLLLRAWQEVEAAEIKANLVIAGTGAPEFLEQIRKQIEHLNLKRIRLHFQFISAEELVALYRAAHIVVYPYRSITTSGALATGLALGKTIIAADLPVFRELLTDRKTALLVDPHDASTFAVALIELINDPALRRHLADNVSALNFGKQSWITIAQQTSSVYQSVLSAPASSLKD